MKKLTGRCIKVPALDTSWKRDNCRYCKYRVYNRTCGGHIIEDMYITDTEAEQDKRDEDEANDEAEQEKWDNF